MVTLSRVSLTSIALGIGVVLGGCAGTVEDESQVPTEQSSASVDKAAVSPDEQQLPAGEAQPEIAVMPSEMEAAEGKEGLEDVGEEAGEKIGTKSDRIIGGWGGRWGGRWGGGWGGGWRGGWGGRWGGGWGWRGGWGAPGWGWGGGWGAPGWGVGWGAPVVVGGGVYGCGPYACW